MKVAEYTLKQIIFINWNVEKLYEDQGISSQKRLDILFPLRNKLNNIDINNPQLAHRICDLIPAQCPFHRQIKLFGKTLATIPPLCKINPLFDELMTLRFRAICYLAEECGEDVSKYC